MKNRKILSLVSIMLVAGSASGCSWYWEKSKQIGSHMPTYDDWFGDEKEKTPPPASAPQQQPHYNYYNNSNSYGTDNTRRMPIPGNASMTPDPVAPGELPPGYPMAQNPPPPQGYPPFPPPPGMPPARDDGFAPPPPPGFPPPGGPGVAPDEGLRRLQMQQQMQQPQSNSYEPPAMPFTEPVMDNMQAMSATITDEQSGERGFFSFADDISEEVGSWFGDSEDAYPKLSDMPESPVYIHKMQEIGETQQELGADLQAARQQQQSTITDWSQLAEMPAEENIETAPDASATLPEPVEEEPLTSLPPTMPESAEPVESIAQPEHPAVLPESITPIAGVEDVPPAIETEQKIPEMAPDIIEPQVIISFPQEKEEVAPVETRPEYLRKPETGLQIDLLPRNRYSGRHR